jgi:hypothetical protein
MTMIEVSFLERLEENVRAISANLACVLMIALLTGACATGDTRQASPEISPPPSVAEVSSSDANEAGQVSAEGEPKRTVNSDDYEEECRTIKVTGSRFKKRVCASKAEWADFDRKNEKE